MYSTVIHKGFFLSLYEQKPQSCFEKYPCISFHILVQFNVASLDPEKYPYNTLTLKKLHRLSTKWIAYFYQSHLRCLCHHLFCFCFCLVSLSLNCLLNIFISLFHSIYMYLQFIFLILVAVPDVFVLILDEICFSINIF